MTFVGYRIDRPVGSSTMGTKLPSMKAKDLLAILQRAPLSYRVTRQSGSHRKLEAPNRPPLLFAFHDSDTLGGSMVKKILVNSVELTADEIDEIL